MIHFRSYASCLVIGATAVMPFSASRVAAGDFGPDHPVTQIPGAQIPGASAGDRCSRLGQGFVDVGNGLCGRVSRHVRVYVGGNNAALYPPANAWTTHRGTANAAMRADNLVPDVMVPHADVTHLRVRGSLDSFGAAR